MDGKTDDLEEFLKEVDSLTGYKPVKTPKPTNPRKEDKIDFYSNKNGVDPYFIRAVIGQESAGDPNAKSWANAKGLMQLTDAVGKRHYGDKYDPFNQDINLDAGTKEIKRLSDVYKGDLKRVLAAYNAGEGNANKSNWYEDSRNWSNDRDVQAGKKPRGDSDKTNTRRYIDKIWGNYQNLSGQKYESLLGEVDEILGNPAQANVSVANFPDNSHSELLGEVDSILGTSPLQNVEQKQEVNPIENLNRQRSLLESDLLKAKTPKEKRLIQQSLEKMDESIYQESKYPESKNSEQKFFTNNQGQVVPLGTEANVLENKHQRPAEGFDENSLEIGLSTRPRIVPEDEGNQYSQEEIDAGYQDYLNFTKEADSPEIRQKYLDAVKGNVATGEVEEIRTKVNSPEIRQNHINAANKGISIGAKKNDQTSNLRMDNPTNYANLGGSEINQQTSGLQRISKIYKTKPTVEQVTQDSAKSVYGDEILDVGEIFRKTTGKPLLETLNGVQEDIDENWNPVTGEYDNIGGNVFPHIQSLVDTYKNGGESALIEKIQKSEYNYKPSNEEEIEDRQIKEISNSLYGTDEELRAKIAEDLNNEKRRRNNPTFAEGIYDSVASALNPIGAISDKVSSLSDTFSGNKDTAVSTDEIEDEFQRRKKLQLDSEAIGRAKRSSERSSSVTSGIYGSAGRTFSAVAGILRPFSAIGIDQLNEKLSKIGNEMQLAEQMTGDGGLSSTISKAVGGSPIDLVRLGILTRLPGGTVVGFAADQGTQSSGRGDSVREIGKNTAKGAALGTLFPVAGKAGEIASSKISPLVSPIARIGTVGVGTTGIEYASGTPLDQAVQAGILNSIFEGVQTYGSQLLGKVGRVWVKGEPVDVQVEPSGNVSIVKFRSKENPNRVDFEMVLDPTDGIYKSSSEIGKNNKASRSDSETANPQAESVNNGNRIGADENLPQRALVEKNPLRMENPMPESVTRVQNDARAQKILKILENNEVLSLDQLQKATKYSRQNVTKAIDDLYSSRAIEINPDNTIRLIQADHVISPNERPLYERFSQKEQPKQPIELGESPLTPEEFARLNNRPAPLTETQKTLELQTRSALDDNSNRSGVLITAGERMPDVLGMQDLTKLELPTGEILLVNPFKMKVLHGLKTPEEIQSFVQDPLNLQKVLGRVEHVGDTSKGNTVVSRDGAGNELNSTVITSPENAQAQAALDKQNFPQNYAESEVMPTQAAVAERASKLATADRIFKEKQFNEMQKKASEMEAKTAKIVKSGKSQESGVSRQTVFTERGTKASIEPKVIDSSQILTSLDEGYPQELQPRDRSRSASKVQIAEIGNKLNPAFLDDSPKASDGRPLVVPVDLNGETKYAVISGNGRTEGIRQAYNSNNQGATDYASFVNQKQATDFQQPVYVGVLDANEIEDLAEFAKEANEQATAAMSSSEQAKSDAERLNPDLLSFFVPAEDGSIHSAANRQFINGFMSNVIGTAESGRLVTADGHLSQEGINRVKNAILSKAFGDSDEGQSLITKIAESNDNNIKKITNSLLNNAGKFVALKQAAKDGTRYENLDITNDLAKGTAKFSSLKNEGVSVEEYLSQPNMFGEELSPFQKYVLLTLDKFSNSQKAVNGILNNYIIAANALGDPKQAALFGGDEIPDTPSLFKAAIEEYELGNYEKQPNQEEFRFEDKGIEVQPETSKFSPKRNPEKNPSVKPKTEKTGYEENRRLSGRADVLDKFVPSNLGAENITKITSSEANWEIEFETGQKTEVPKYLGTKDDAIHYATKAINDLNNSKYFNQFREGAEKLSKNVEELYDLNRSEKPKLKTKHEFSSTQLDLPESTAQEVLDIGKNLIDPKDLTEEGLETKPHITVKFGLHTEDPKVMENILRHQEPIEVTLGKTSIFPGGDDQHHDVVKIEVDSPALRQLNKRIAANTKATDTFPTYKPHITLAYVKKGSGKKYIGNKSLAGSKLVLDNLTFSNKSGEETIFPLKGKPDPIEESQKEINRREVLIYKKYGKFNRIRNSESGEKYVIGDEAWNKHNPDKEEWFDKNFLEWEKKYLAEKAAESETIKTPKSSNKKSEVKNEIPYPQKSTGFNISRGVIERELAGSGIKPFKDKDIDNSIYDDAWELTEINNEQLFEIAKDAKYDVNDFGIEIDTSHAEILRRIQFGWDLDNGAATLHDEIKIFGGLHIPISVAESFAAKLQEVSKSINSSESAKFLDSFANDIIQKAKNDGSLVVFTDEFERTRFHETQHQAAFLGSNGATWEERVDIENAKKQPAFQIARSYLLDLGYPDYAPKLIEETQAFIVENRYGEIGLTKDQAKSFAKFWFTSYAEKGHNLNHPKFDIANEGFTKEILQDVRTELFGGSERNSQETRQTERDRPGIETDDSLTGNRNSATNRFRPTKTEAAERDAEKQLQDLNDFADDPFANENTKLVVQKNGEAFINELRKTDSEIDNAFYKAPQTKQKQAKTIFQRAIYDTRTSTIPDVVVGMRRAGLLTGPKTHLRNVLGNTAFQISEEAHRPISALVDAIISVKTGQRTVENINPVAIGKSIASIIKQDQTLKNLDMDSGIKKAWSIIRRGDTKENLEKQQLLQYQSGFKILDGYVNFVFRTLSAEDALFKAYSLRRSLEEQAAMIAKTEEKSGSMVNWRSRRKQLLENPTKEMQAEALLVADYMTFQDNNLISEGFTEGKNWLKEDGGIGGKAAVMATEILVPFDRTPTNIVFRTLDYTPLGLIRAGKSLHRIYREIPKGMEQFILEDEKQDRIAQRRKAIRAAWKEKAEGRIKDKQLELKNIELEIKDAAQNTNKTRLNSLLLKAEKIQNQLNDLITNMKVREAKSKLKDADLEDTYEALRRSMDRIFSRREQAYFANSIGRAGLGTSALVLGIILASKGLLSGIWDFEEKDEKKEYFRRQSDDVMNGSLEIPDVGRFVITDSPLGKVMVTGATIYEQANRPLKKGEDVSGQQLNAAFNAGKKLIFEQPLLNTIDEYFGSNKTMEQRAGGLIGSFIPSILNSWGEITDNEQRDSRGLLGPAMKRTPFLREKLPIGKFPRTPYLQDKNNRILNQIDPTSFRPAKLKGISEELKQELERFNIRKEYLKDPEKIEALINSDRYMDSNLAIQEKMLKSALK